MHRILIGSCVAIALALCLGVLGIVLIVLSLPATTRVETATDVVVHVQQLDWIGLLKGMTAMGAGALTLWACWPSRALTPARPAHQA